MPRLSCIELTHSEQTALLEIARLSIANGLLNKAPLSVNIASQPGALCEQRGVFVTLLSDGSLRGCIGTLEAEHAIALAVADSAYNAAFRDPRFDPLRRPELDAVRIEISILSHMVDLQAADRAELLASLRPGTDGLLLWEGRHHATFLPTVWEQLPEPGQFLEHLLTKAGLAGDYWSSTLRLQRYTTLTICE